MVDGIGSEILQLLGLPTVGASAIVLGAAFARIAPLLWITPFLGGPLLSRGVKLVLILAFGIAILPGAAQFEAELNELSSVGLALLMAKESFIGISIGFVASLIFRAIAAAGSLIDAARGGANSEIFLTNPGERSTATEAFLFQLSLVVFLALGGHQIFLRTVAASYLLLPLNRFPAEVGLAALAQLCGRLMAQILSLALALAAPVLATIFITDIALGWLGRFVPNVSIFFVAMPGRAVLGIAILALSLAALLGALPEVLRLAMESVSEVTRMLSLQ